MRTIAIILFTLMFLKILVMLDARTAECYRYKQDAMKYRTQYDSLVEWDGDISNHIRKDFGIDTTAQTQYKQINNRINGKKGVKENNNGSDDAGR